MTIAILRKEGTLDGSPELLSQVMSRPSTVVVNGVDQFPEDTSAIVRFGCTGNIPKGIQVINSARAIHRVTDKAGFRDTINVFCPQTWQSLEEFRADVPDFTDGVIVRPRTHERGSGMYLAYDMPTVERVCARLNNEVYIQDHIDKVVEYRVHVVQGRVVSIFEKIPASNRNLAWNMATTVNVRWSEWPIAVATVALGAFALSKLHFGAVDVIVAGGGEPFVLEVNTCPELTPYFATKFGRAFDWMQNNDNFELDLGDIDWQGDVNYKDIIHPSALL